MTHRCTLRHLRINHLNPGIITILQGGDAGVGQLLIALGDMVSNRKAGREFMTLTEDEQPIAPFVYNEAPGNYVASVTEKGKLLLFSIAWFVRWPRVLNWRTNGSMLLAGLIPIDVAFATYPSPAEISAMAAGLGVTCMLRGGWKLGSLGGLILAAIAQVGLADEEGEESESQLFAVCEYVRMAALTVFLECNLPQAGAAPDRRRLH